MVKITISNDTVDKLFGDILSQDYLRLISDINAMERRVSNGEKLKQYEIEDLENWIKTAQAINVLFDWYLSPDDADKIRNK